MFVSAIHFFYLMLHLRLFPHNVIRTKRFETQRERVFGKSA